jgi:hypothetical protein
MEQAMIFVRTKLEADNLENYFAQFGGSKPGISIHCLFFSSIVVFSEIELNIYFFFGIL